MLELTPAIQPEIEPEIQPEIEKPAAAIVPLFNAIQEKALALNGKNIAETLILEAQGGNTGEIPDQILKKPKIVDHTGFDDELYQMAMIINGQNIRKTPVREQYGKRPGMF